MCSRADIKELAHQQQELGEVKSAALILVHLLETNPG